MTPTRRRRRDRRTETRRLPADGRLLLAHELIALLMAGRRPFTLAELCRRLWPGGDARVDPWRRRRARRQLELYVRAGLLARVGGRRLGPETYWPVATAAAGPPDDGQRAARERIAARREMWLAHYNRGRAFFAGLL